MVYKESGNLPKWAENDPLHFWNAADKYERINGRAYYEFEIAIPNELSYEQSIKLVQELVSEHIGPDKAYTFAIHDKQASLEPWNKNLHAHIMFCERINDNRPENKFFLRYNPRYSNRGGAKKDDRFSARQGAGAATINALRRSAAGIVNKHLVMNGFSDIRVDYRSLRDQKIAAKNSNDEAAYKKLQDKIPELHLGPKLTANYIRAMKKLNNEQHEHYFLEVADQNTRQTYIAKTIKSLEKELAALMQERAQLAELCKDLAEFNSGAEKSLESADYFSNYPNADAVSAIYDRKIEDTQIIITNSLALKKELQEAVKTKEELRTKAIDIYTNNAYSKSLERLKNINEIGQKWAKRYQAFKKSLPPPATDIPATAAYTAELQLLQKDDRILQECEAAEKQQLNKINILLRSANGKAAINELMSGLEKNNDAVKERLNLCKESLSRAYQFKKELIRAKALSKIIYEIKHELGELGIHPSVSKAEFTKNALSIGQIWLNLDKQALSTPAALEQFNLLLTEQQRQLGELNKQYGEQKLQLMKKLLSPDKIDSLSLAMGTSFQSTHIRRQKTKLMKSRKAYEKELSEFKYMKKPGLLEFTYRKEYNDKKKRLQRRQQLLNEREKRFQGYQWHYEKELSRPETIAKIQEFKQSLVTKNSILESRISAINESIQLNKELIQDIIQYKQEAYSYFITSKKSQVPPQRIQAVMGKMNAVVHNAKEARSDRGMLGKMHLDDEEGRYYKNKSDSHLDFEI